jgi:hypothetical protein
MIGVVYYSTGLMVYKISPGKAVIGQNVSPELYKDLKIPSGLLKE